MKTNQSVRSTFFSSRFLCALISLAALAISGCDDLDKINDDAAKRPVTNAFTPGMEEQKTTGEQKPKPAVNAADAAKPANPAPPAGATAAEQHAPPKPDENLQKAEAGVGAQGKDYGGGVLMAPITTPVREYFGMRERVNFDMIKHDMDIYFNINNRYPKNWDEFQKEIIEPGNRELPELPKGDEYVYDGKKGELLVRHSPPKQ